MIKVQGGEGGIGETGAGGREEEEKRITGGREERGYNIGIRRNRKMRLVKKGGKKKEREEN